MPTMKDDPNSLDYFPKTYRLSSMWHLYDTSPIALLDNNSFLHHPLTWPEYQLIHNNYGDSWLTSKQCNKTAYDIYEELTEGIRKLKDFKGENKNMRREELNGTVTFEFDLPGIKKDKVQVYSQKDCHGITLFYVEVEGKDPYVIRDTAIKMSDLSATKVKLEDGVLTITLFLLPEYHRQDFIVM
jgi:hypothetical protein